MGKLFPVGQQWNKYKGTVTEVWQDSEQNFMFHVRHRHPSIPCLSVCLSVLCSPFWDIEVGSVVRRALSQFCWATLTRRTRRRWCTTKWTESCTKKTSTCTHISPVD